MPLIRSRWGEFTKFVSNHILGHIYRKELPSVVHVEGMTDHLRENCRSPRPSLDNFLIIPLVELDHLLIELLVYIWTLLD